jgi:hypothetical protein
MSISLQIGVMSYPLPDALQWSDELGWSPVKQAVELSVTGALLVDVAVQQAGRPITLGQPGTGSVFIARSVLDALYASATVPGQEMTLTLRGVAHTVLWRHQDGEVITATPRWQLEDVQPDDLYTVTLKFMEI